MANELAAREITLPVWEIIKAVAPTIRGSGLFGVANEAAATAIMLKGYELGMGLTASFEHIHVIDGKTSLSPRGALAIVLQSPLCAGIDIVPLESPIGCKVTAKRTNGMTFTAIFTVDDAKAADLVKGKGGWEKYPKQMCQWRAVGYALDVVFPDVIGGLKRADELGADLTATGDVIEGSWTQVSPAPVSHKKLDGEAQAQLAQMLEDYSPETILAANHGKMPKTAEEIDATLNYLNAQSVSMEDVEPLAY